ncbi:SRPBCC family protein [Larkinella soli]|uniref:SRPBCC family protein n=1 Tax=Larkinella soli TaxID=1770527 RepID=UPI000FFB207E|nr:SRPBCC family protein [Larkinella soli]
MKILKILGIVVLALVVLVLAVGLIVPTEYAVERSVVIAKPRSEVFRLVGSLRNQARWSPWADNDPAMKVTYTGADGTVGSSSAWQGNSDVGTGEQEIKDLVPNEMVHNEVRFREPIESVGQVFLTLSDVAAGTSTKVTWKMTGKNAYPMNAMSVVMDMDGMIGKDFERGLDKLKKLSEQPAAVATN